MEKITELLDGLENLGTLLPELNTVTDWIQWLIAMAVRVGPVCILALGLIYLLIPPKEANRVAGYRTYFGMGSVEAWMFTQRVSGAIMTVVGFILFLIARSAVKKFDGMDLMAMGEKAFDLIKVQIICALVIYVFMFLLTAVMFNRKGDRRFGPKQPQKKNVKKENQKPVKAAAKVNVAAANKEVKVNYERQGEQVITADDIVIEGLE